MRSFFIQFSGLTGIVIFLNNLWNNASLERTVFVSLAVGVGIYFVLIAGENIIQQIINKTAPVIPEEAKVKNETLAANPKGKPAA
ncbi:MAG: hypothetical protein AB8G77_16500 [Rhodothermales bacterium]